MTFYTDLRDDTVAPLLDEYGFAATLKRKTGTFNTATGENVVTSASTTAQALLLGKSSLERSHPAQAQLCQDACLLSAAGLSAPSVKDVLTFGGEDWRIVFVDTIGPGNVAVAYIVGIAK